MYTQDKREYLAVQKNPVHFYIYRIFLHLNLVLSESLVKSL